MQGLRTCGFWLNLIVTVAYIYRKDEAVSDITGGCQCGHIRYEARGDAVLTAVCLCSHCQKLTGTSFSILVGVPNESLSIKGQLKTFLDTGTSGKPVHRKFCPDCGSPIVSVVDAVPGLTFIKAGTLDETHWLKPTVEIWCRSAQPWVTLSEDTKKSETSPNS